MWTNFGLAALLALVSLAPAQAQRSYYLPRDYADRDRVYPDRYRDDGYRDDRLHGGERRVWRYEVNGGGAFKHVRGRQWVEVRRNGPPIHYREMDRNEDYIELYDARRDLRVRLHDDVYYHSERGRRWDVGAEGRWQ